MRFHCAASLRAAISILFLGSFAGCSLDLTSIPALNRGIPLKGGVHGGQQPVVGARVYFLAAGTSGYDAVSTSLLTTGTAGSDAIGGYVLTDTGGFFNITGDYTCTQGQQTYVLALGGNPGSGANNASAMMAAVGSCPATGNFLGSVPFINIDEVTTVAFAYSVAGFAVDSTHISSSNTALAMNGIANAFANTGNLLNGAITPAGNGTVPIAEINTLANIIAACINTNGSITGPAKATACYTLFQSATNGAVMPTDTAAALINIAHNPSNNVPTLFNLQTGAAPFIPSLTAAPTDFSLALTFTGGGLSTSTAQMNETLQAVNNIAIDASGNIWKPNYGSNSLTELSSLGVPLSTSTGFTGGGLSSPANIAVDLSGNIWIPNIGSSTVSELTASGTPVSGSPFGAGIINRPSDLAIDPYNNVWIAGASTVTKLTSLGTNASGSPFSTNTLNGPIGMAILPNGSVWISNAYSNTIAVYTNSGAAASGSPYIAGGLAYPYGIAFDSSLNGFITNQASVSQLSVSGTNITGSPFTSPTGTIPTAIAIDGAGTAWITETTDNSILKLTSGTYLSGVAGFQSSQTSIPEAIAVDGSGNVWYTSYNDATIHELVGAAAPTVTPIAYAVKNSLLGTRP